MCESGHIYLMSVSGGGQGPPARALQLMVIQCGFTPTRAKPISGQEWPGARGVAWRGAAWRGVARRGREFRVRAAGRQIAAGRDPNAGISMRAATAAERSARAASPHRAVSQMRRAQLTPVLDKIESWRTRGEGGTLARDTAAPPRPAPALYTLLLRTGRCGAGRGGVGPVAVSSASSLRG